MREMKDSGVAWIGEIPHSWNVVRNKGLIFEVNERCEADTDLPLLSVSEYYGIAPKAEKIADGDYISRAESLKDYKICHVDDVVMNIMLAWKRAQGVSNFNGIVSPAYCVYRKKENAPINMAYYHYLIRSDLYISVFKRYSTGIIDSRLRLYPDKFLALYSHVPPLEEQQKIAAHLDRKCTQIDALISNAQQQIEKLKAYKQSIINETVTKGIEPDVPLKNSGVEWIGMIPEHWGIVRGKVVLKLLSRTVQENDEVITCFRDGEVTLRKNRREDGFTFSDKEIGYQGVEPNDLVIHGMDGFAGAIGVSDSRGKASPVLIVCDSEQNKRFLMYYFRSLAYRNIFLALSTGIRVRSCDLRWNKLSVLPVVLPPITDQQKIAAYIDHKYSQIDKLIALKQQKIEKLQQYKKSLIYEYVTGKKEV